MSECLTTRIGYPSRVGDSGFDEPGEVTLPVVEGDAVLQMLDAEDGGELGVMGGEEDVEGLVTYYPISISVASASKYNSLKVLNRPRLR